MLDLSKKEDRKKLLKFFDSSNETEQTRVKQSIYETEIYSGKIHKHVKAFLDDKYDASTVKEMSIFSTANMTKKIANQEASLYKDAPTRTFSGIDDDKPIKDLYDLMKVDQKLLRSNRLFRTQLQNAIQVKVNRGKIELHPLKQHNYKVYEELDGDLIYIIPNLRHVHTKDTDFDKNKNSRFTIWSEKFNFVMDGHGEITSENEDLSNPLGLIPIIDVSGEKDDCYFVDDYRGLAEFTIQFNAALTDLLHVMRMQGFSISIVKGPADLIDKVTQVTVGINKVLRLPTTVDQDGNVKECDFQFASPSPDIPGSIQVIETLLSAFLSSEGVDPRSVKLNSSSEAFSSGWERLLALIERFNATKEDISIYQDVERQLFNIIQVIMEKYSNNTTKVLDKEYIVQGLNNVSISVEYKEPEMVETQAEKEDRAYVREEKGVASRVDTTMTVHRLKDRDAAKKKLKEIEEEKAQFGNTEPKVEIEETEDEDELEDDS